MEPQSPEQNIKDVESVKTNREHMPVIQQLSIALGILVLVFGTTYMGNKTEPKQTGTLQNVAETTQIITPTNIETPSATDSFETVTLQARSAYVWDVKEQRVLYSKNPDETLPLASVAKLMTALVAYELLGNNSTVRIGANAIAQEGDSGFGVGESFRSRNLLDLTLINSSNDGAFALAAAAGGSATNEEENAAAFVTAMNLRAEDLGLTTTSFKNPTGLDIAGSTAGAVGSARDMAFLMEYLVTHYPETLELTRKSDTRIANEVGNLHDAENTNHLAANIPSLLGSKTGYTDLAGGNLVIAFDVGLNHPIVIAVLGSSQEGRFTDVNALVKATRAEMQQQ